MDINGRPQGLNLDTVQWASRHDPGGSNVIDRKPTIQSNNTKCVILHVSYVTDVLWQRG